MSTFFPNARLFTISDSSFHHVQGDQLSSGYSSIVPAQEEKHTEFDDFRIVKRGDVYPIRDVSVAEGRQSFGWLLDIPNADIRKQICTAKLDGVEGDFTTVTYRGRDARAAFEEDVRNLRERSPGSPELYAVTTGTTQSLVFRQEPLGVQSQQALYTDPPDSLHPPDLAPTPAAQDDTSGTDPSKPFHSQPSPESDPAHTHSQTNPPENTAPQDHASHGSTSSQRPFSPAENLDTPPAAQDDTGSVHHFDSRSQEGNPVTTQSYMNQNHNGDNFDGCTVGRTSRDTITYDIKIELGLPAAVTISAAAISAVTVSHTTTIAAPEPHSISPALAQFSLPYFPSINSPVGVIALVLILRHYIMSLSRSSHLIFNS
ncbi:hypothetical protein PQX77_001294 [Marasmius sp. AFHP31]|nr:hypothetical protein PQX77_001294 [Marasmius sp. AFHP31]